MITDPIERIVADGLRRAGINFQHESEGNGSTLDFYLPDEDVFIEVKQFHSERIARQMASVSNVIAIQGRGAAVAFVSMLSKKG